MSKYQEAIDAGYSDEEIKSFLGDKYSSATSEGYSQQEIEQHLGVPTGFFTPTNTDEQVIETTNADKTKVDLINDKFSLQANQITEAKNNIDSLNLDEETKKTMLNGYDTKLLDMQIKQKDLLEKEQAKEIKQSDRALSGIEIGARKLIEPILGIARLSEEVSALTAGLFGIEKERVVKNYIDRNKKEVSNIEKQLGYKEGDFITPSNISELGTNITTSMIPIFKAGSTVGTVGQIATQEGLSTGLQSYGSGKSGEESINEASISSLLGATTAKIATKLFPESGEKLTKFGKTVQELDSTSRAELNKTLATLDELGINKLDDKAVDILLTEAKKGTIDSNKLADNIKASIDSSKSDVLKTVDSLYKESDKVAENIVLKPEDVKSLRDNYIQSSGIKGRTLTNDEKEAYKNIMQLFSDNNNPNVKELKRTTLDKLESIISDATGTQKKVYMTAKDEVDKMLENKGATKLYNEADEAYKKYLLDFTGKTYTDVSTAGKSINKVMKNVDVTEEVSKNLLGSKIDTEKIGTVVKDLKPEDKNAMFAEILQKGTKGAGSREEEVKSIVSNFKSINPEGAIKLIGKDGYDSAKKNIEALALAQVTLNNVNKADASIAGDLMKVAEAGILSKVSPIFATRQAHTYLGRVLDKREMVKNKGQLLKQANKIENPELKRNVIMLLGRSIDNQTLDMFKQEDAGE